MSDWYADRAVKKHPLPEGNVHMHFLYRSHKPVWVVRMRHTSLCGTPRCRLVNMCSRPVGLA